MIRKLNRFEISLEVTQMMELVNRDSKTIIVVVVHGFKKLWERFSMLMRNLEGIKRHTCTFMGGSYKVCNKKCTGQK